MTSSRDGDGPSTQPDVVVLQWPADAELRGQVAASGHACLLRVAAGAQPPSEWGPFEDWLREPIDQDELDVRRARLRRRLVARLPVWLDESELLHRGSAWVALAPMEARLLEPLLAHKDEVVSRSLLRMAIDRNSSGQSPRLVDGTLKRLRRRVGPLGVTIHTVRGTGFLLEVREPPD